MDFEKNTKDRKTNFPSLAPKFGMKVCPIGLKMFLGSKLVKHPIKKKLTVKNDPKWPI